MTYIGTKVRRRTAAGEPYYEHTHDHTHLRSTDPRELMAHAHPHIHHPKRPHRHVQVQP